MARIFLSLIALVCMFNISYAQPTNLIPVTGKVGIGTLEPKAMLDVIGNVAITSALDNTSIRPIVSSTTIPGEIRAYSSSNEFADDGFLRLSAGAGTNSPTMSFIDISGYSTLSDMNMNIVLGTNGLERMRILNSGNVGIGTSNPIDKLSVNGRIRAHEIKVEASNWPDYVFAKEYQLPTLQEIEKHIKERGHLSGIPSAGEVMTNGVDLGEMNVILLKKIEELTLHLIEKEKRDNVQQSQLIDQQKVIESLLNRVLKIERSTVK